MVYNDVPYRYAFKFKVPVEHGLGDKLPNVIISDYIDYYQNYSGICLENGLIVYSDRIIPYEAFFDIINKIVNNTLEIEKAYAEAHSVELSNINKRVSNYSFLKRIIKKNNSEKTLSYYQKLKIYFENPEKLSEDIPERLKLDLCDYTNILLLSSLIRNNSPQLKELKFCRL